MKPPVPTNTMGREYWHTDQKQIIPAEQNTIALFCGKAQLSYPWYGASVMEIPNLHKLHQPNEVDIESQESKIGVSKHHRSKSI